MIKKTFNVPDMQCSNCSMKLESIEDDLEKIASVEGLDAHIRTVSLRSRRKK